MNIDKIKLEIQNKPCSICKNLITYEDTKYNNFIYVKTRRKETRVCHKSCLIKNEINL